MLQRCTNPDSHKLRVDPSPTYKHKAVVAGACMEHHGALLLRHDTAYNLHLPIALPVLTKHATPHADALPVSRTTLCTMHSLLICWQLFSTSPSSLLMLAAQLLSSSSGSLPRPMVTIPAGRSIRADTALRTTMSDNSFSAYVNHNGTPSKLPHCIYAVCTRLVVVKKVLL